MTQLCLQPLLVLGIISVWAGIKSSPLFAAPLPTAANNQTLNRALIVGYQGWFAAPGDGSQLTATSQFNHWLIEDDLNRPETDFWPDLSEYPESAKRPIGYTLFDGSPAHIFSNYDLDVVKLHFQWMQEYGIDGAFVGRSIRSITEPNPAFKDFRDRVLQNVRTAAQATGRVFYVNYDISGARPERDVFADIENDWKALVDAQDSVVSSSRYLKHGDKPVIRVFGIGSVRGDTDYTAADASAFIKRLRGITPELEKKYHATVIVGIAQNWRTFDPNSQTDTIRDAWSMAGWADADFIQPWSVNAFTNETGADNYLSRMRDDLTYIRELNTSQGKTLGYLPVIWPGFSWYNKQAGEFGGQLLTPNQVSRQGGQFIWRQIYNSVTALTENTPPRNVTALTVAMFDEMDEGTAIFKQAPTCSQVPNLNNLTSFQNGQRPVYLPLDIDDYDLPSDWYLQIATEASKVLKGTTFLEQRFPLSLTIQARSVCN
jgi:hypothetical protein